MKTLTSRPRPTNLLSTVSINRGNINKWAILDSGASSHFLAVGAPITKKEKAITPISVTLPDGTKVQSTHTRDLRITQLPKSARVCHIVPGLASYSLISVVKLCKAGCEVSFTRFGIGVKVHYRGQLVLEGSKCLTTGLWMVPLDTMSTANTTKIVTPLHTHTTKVRVANNVTSTSSQAEIAKYHHQSLGNPPKSTLLKAIKIKAIYLTRFQDYPTN